VPSIRIARQPYCGVSQYGCAVSDEPEWYEQILELQLSRNPEAWARFRDQGVDRDELRLGFIYLAPDEEAAHSLARFLWKQTDYEVEVHHQPVGDETEPTWLVIGATQPTLLTLELLDEWVQWMVAAGAAEGPCAFDGWAAQFMREDEDEDEDDEAS
jgi:hypothetical protein